MDLAAGERGRAVRGGALEVDGLAELHAAERVDAERDVGRRGGRRGTGERERTREDEDRPSLPPGQRQGQGYADAPGGDTDS